jgi:hypothetical protein
VISITWGWRREGVNPVKQNTWRRKQGIRGERDINGIKIRCLPLLVALQCRKG